MDELNEIRQHLLRFSPDALVVVDDRGTIRFANETVREMFGYEPDVLIGRPVDFLIPERLRGQHGQHLVGYMAKPDSREMGARITDLFALRADGSEFAAGIRLSPFSIGGQLFVSAAIRDTSEHRAINQDLLAARREAERANRAKSRFLATASHDLRQPMQTVRLLNAAMLKVVPQPELRELLEQQSHAIESMARLLNSLLDISRLESGAIEPVTEDVPLMPLFAELRAEFESVARSRDVVLRLDAPAVVLATDRTLLSQLLHNLIGNALKYTDSGSVFVRCAVDEDAVTIAVEDTGIGIPADKLARIFDEYYQVDTHGTKRMGVGLGLAIVKEVARLLGFSVKITSELGRGTRACVRIPRRFTVVAKVTAMEPAAVRAAAEPTSRARVLLVEDNDGVRLATQTYLKFEGFETLAAATVAEAERLFTELRPADIVIADFHLDGKNTGLEMLEALRARLGYDVAGIVLSGDLPSVLRSIKVPVANCRFLSKPVDTAALVTAIRELSAGSGNEHSGPGKLSRAQPG